jgi:AraC-like DNA-binding protein
MHYADPIAFEEFLAPVGGEVRIRPVVGSRFRANMEIRRLQRVGLFTIEADSFSAQKVPQQDFFGFSIPLNVPFTVSESGYEQTFGRSSAHMLSPGRPFNFQCKKKCHTMACNFFVDSLESYRESLLQKTSASQKFLEPQVSLMSAAGSGLFRSVIRAWVALGMDNSSVSKIALQEMEDDLLASFLYLAEDPQAIEKEAALPADYTLKHAEDYICANLGTAITRDDLANMAGVSIRSLSRAFEKKYGLGPMAFVRQRRLDACYSRLQGSEPGTTTVTDVAMSHGFSHVGKFAIAYKKAFGESPSTSLIK